MLARFKLTFFFVVGVLVSLWPALASSPSSCRRHMFSAADRTWIVGYSRQARVPTVIGFGHQFFLLPKLGDPLRPIVLLNNSVAKNKHPALATRAMASFSHAQGELRILNLQTDGSLWVYRPLSAGSFEHWTGTEIPIPPCFANDDSWQEIQTYRCRGTSNHILVFLRSQSGIVIRGELFFSREGISEIYSPFVPVTNLPGGSFEVVGPHQLVWVDQRSNIYWIDGVQRDWRGVLTIKPTAIFVPRNFGWKVAGTDGKSSREERLTLWGVGPTKEGREFHVERWQGHIKKSYDETAKVHQSISGHGYNMVSLLTLDGINPFLWLERTAPSRRTQGAGALLATLRSQTADGNEKAVYSLTDLMGELPLKFLKWPSESTETSMGLWAKASAHTVYRLLADDSVSAYRAENAVRNLVARTPFLDLMSAPDFQSTKKRIERELGDSSVLLSLELTAAILGESPQHFVYSWPNGESSLSQVVEVLRKPLDTQIYLLSTSLEPALQVHLYRLKEILSGFSSVLGLRNDEATQNGWLERLSDTRQFISASKKTKLSNALSFLAARWDPLRSVHVGTDSFGNTSTYTLKPQI